MTQAAEAHAVLPPEPTVETWFSEVQAGLREGRLAPYLGPGLVALAGAQVPSTTQALAGFLAKKVALPKRTIGNLWSSAQYIDNYKHRTTLVSLMAEAFATPLPPTSFHSFLATLPLPLIVDTWYDGSMRAAMAGRSDWAEIQAIPRAELGETGWYRAYDPKGQRISATDAATCKTLLYKPHGAALPAKNFLVADSDYVETLTEIDIQTPIPDLVKTRRTHLGFLYLGCRFDDQLLRTYARQIAKRSAGPSYIVVPPTGLTRNERSFIAQQGLRVLVSPLGDVLSRLEATP